MKIIHLQEGVETFGRPFRTTFSPLLRACLLTCLHMLLRTHSFISLSLMVFSLSVFLDQFFVFERSFGLELNKETSNTLISVFNQKPTKNKLNNRSACMQDIFVIAIHKYRISINTYQCASFFFFFYQHSF